MLISRPSRSESATTHEERAIHLHLLRRDNRDGDRRRPRNRARDHLECEHYGDLLPDFVDAYGGKRSENGCGQTFPSEGSEIADYDFPTRGHDAFPAFAKRYVYWRIDV